MIDLNKFKDLFISEVEDHLQKLNDNLLALEKNPTDKKLMNELMRSSHTMKSSSAMMGYKKMSFLTHVMEDVFDYARNDQLKLTPEIINKLFETFDILEESLMSIKKTGKELDVDSTIKEIKEMTGVATEGTGKSPRTPEGKPIIKNSKNQPEQEKDDKNNELNNNNEEIVKKKSEQKINFAPVEEFIQRIDYIKVPVKRLDNLMSLMEELLIDRMRLEQFKDRDAKLGGVISHLNRLVSDIQYQVMQSRLVPIEQIFARFPRMIRDVAKSLGKKANLEITGGEIELDRTIVDKLGEPLVHLLRNAVDHGIKESGTIKLKAKREKDFALIIVENDGNSIDWEKVVESAVKKGIIDKRQGDYLISDLKLKIADFRDKKVKDIKPKSEIIDLLYNPRLSTKDKVTEISGRGVGLSVVKNFVDQIGGRIEIKSPLSEEGGTRFTLELPLTLAIINSLLVEVRNSLFAIPFSNIERSVSIFREEIKSMADQDIAVIDGTDVPLVYLSKVFALNKGKDRKIKNAEKVKEDEKDVENFSSSGNSKITVVLVKRGSNIAGLVVDNLVNEQEIIVKSLPPVLRKTKGFSGSTILGDGKTILILDIASLLEDTSKLIRTS